MYTLVCVLPNLILKNKNKNPLIYNKTNKKHCGLELFLFFTQTLIIFDKIE